MTVQTFDVQRLVEHFGGKASLHAKLVGAGMKLNIRTIEQWLYRKRIPATVLATMLRLSVTDGQPLDLAAFTRRVSDSRPDTTDLRAISSLLD